MDAGIADQPSKSICFTEFLLSEDTRDLISHELFAHGPDAAAIQVALISRWHAISDEVESRTTASELPERHELPEHAYHPACDPIGHSSAQDRSERCAESSGMCLASLDHALWARTLRRHH